MRFIRIQGARQNNLRDVSCTIPRGRLTVLTGPSGSGKSSLAFDTLFAEAQRRYTESLSPNARQLVERLPRPDVDSIEGLSPALALRQSPQTPSRHVNIGSQTEIYSYLRLLFARAGNAHCPICDRLLSHTTTGQLVKRLCGLPSKTRIILYAPVKRDDGTSLATAVEQLLGRGFVRGRLGEEDLDFSHAQRSVTDTALPLYVTIDRIVVHDEIRSRLTDSVELGFNEGSGSLFINYPETGENELVSKHPVCPEHGVQPFALEPKHFSSRSQAGACGPCNGTGQRDGLELERLFPRPSLTLQQGACAAFGPPGSVSQAVRINQVFRGCKAVDVSMPWEALSPDQQNAFLFGPKDSPRNAGWPGLHEWLTSSDVDGEDPPPEGAMSATERRAFVHVTACDLCSGTGLGEVARSVSWRGHRLPDLVQRSVSDVRNALREVASTLRAKDAPVETPLVDAILTRLSFLCDVDLGYLALSRPLRTLSAGEAQRVNLSSLLGARLEGALYVLDEPTARLDELARSRVMNTVRHLVDCDNTVVVVEHSREAILAADYVLDLGPGAGSEGGRVVAEGSPEQLRSNPASVTGPFLWPPPVERTPVVEPKDWLEFGPIEAHNVRGVSCRLPRGGITVVTGRSGAGKSSLAMGGVLAHARQAIAGQARHPSLAFLRRVVSVDQSPIGRSPRSTPASYCGLFTSLRELFAATPEAKARGYRSARFSFNKKGGRCEACLGSGSVRVKMQFLPDVFVPCEVCEESRYEPSTLEVRYRGHSIADVLALTVTRAEALLGAHPKLAAGLRSLKELGLGYITLGQPATTLSGGEAQRIKLAAELSRGTGEGYLCVLDEPCSGLHFTDVLLLTRALIRLRDQGSTLIVVEHNREVLQCADWVLEMGPGPGEEGGKVVFAGRPTSLAAPDD